MDQHKANVLTELCIHMLIVSKSLTWCNNIIDSVYKTDVLVGGIPVRVSVDSSQVCIVKKQRFPYVKEIQNWSVSAQHLTHSRL